MNIYTPAIIKKIMYPIFSILFVALTQQTQAAPLACSPTLYQSIGKKLMALDPVTGNYTQVGASSSAVYNAMGWDGRGNYIFAYRKADKQLIKIDDSGQSTNLGVPVEETSGVPITIVGSQTADMDGNGHLWVYDRREPQVLYKINVDANTYTKVSFTGDSAEKPNDLVYISSTNSLWGINKGNNKLVRFNLDNLTITSTPVSTLPALDTSVGYGAAWTNANNELYVGYNSGGIYRIDNYLSAPSATYVIPSSSTNNNDGASCPLAGRAFSPGSISGSVEDTTGAAVSGVRIEIRNASDSSILINSTTGSPLSVLTEADGSYYFANVPVGNYLIVETDLSGATSTADSDSSNDNDLTANTSQTDNIIPVTVAVNEDDVDNNFVDTVSTGISPSSSGSGLQCINTSPSAPTFINYWSNTGGSLPSGARHSNAKNFREGTNVYVAAFCAEKADLDPQENNVYSAHSVTRQTLSPEKINFLEHLYAGLEDPDITTPLEAAFPGDLERTMDNLFQYLTWYYTHWDQDYALVQDMIDYRATANSFTAEQKTAFEAAAVLGLNRSKGINGETQYPKKKIYWLYNETDAGRQDVIVPQSYIVGSNCSDSDFGDAPQSYGDAEHIISDDLYIGEVKPDMEGGSTYSVNALGDGDEDDGALLVPGLDETQEVRHARVDTEKHHDLQKTETLLWELPNEK